MVGNSDTANATIDRALVDLTVYRVGYEQGRTTADARLAALQVAMREIARQAKMWAAIDVDRAFLRDCLRRVADRLEALQTSEAQK